MKKQITVESLTNEMMDIVNNPQMVKAFSEAAKALGISAKEWNDNKAFISSMFACKLMKRHSKDKK